MDRIVICRSSDAEHPLKPGYVLGYNCKQCGRALQVGPTGKAMIEVHQGTPVCNHCGFEIERKLRADGVEVKVALSPEAQRQLDEAERTINNRWRNQKR